MDPEIMPYIGIRSDHVIIAQLSEGSENNTLVDYVVLPYSNITWDYRPGANEIF